MVTCALRPLRVSSLVNGLGVRFQMGFLHWMPLATGRVTKTCTWRASRFSPSAGGLSIDGSRWIATRPNFLLPVLMLSKLFHPGARRSVPPAFILTSQCEVQCGIWLDVVAQI